MNIQIAYLSVALVSFILGGAIGFFLRGLVGNAIENKLDQSFFVLSIVTLVWAISMIVDIVSPQYETSPMVHGLMGGIVGFYFYKPKK
jgi:hypothetical protein